ncbi:MAG: BamA/TamA family outer membrane protein, partial [Steroidobacteraceae bacterium]
IPPPLQHVAAAPLPSDAQLEAAGARIGKIEIHIVQIFDLANPADNNWVFRLADRLHVPTRPSVVRAQLLFRSGQRYSRKLLDESARNIRQNSQYLREPVIRPIRYHDGLVDIEVITHDVWTLEPGTDFSRSGGANAFGFQFSDVNFLGTGKHITAGHSENVDRTSNYANWTDPNVAGTHWADALAYAHNSDGTVWGVAGAYPFYSLETPYAAGVDAGDNHSIVQRYRLGQHYDSYDSSWHTADLYLGKSLLISDTWTDRLLVGWRMDRSYFNQARTYALRAPLPSDRKLSYPFVRMQWTQNRYVTTRNLDLIARTEDVHEGLDASIGLGWAAPLFGADRHSLIADSEISDVFAFGQTQQLFVNARVASRFEDGAVHDAIATGNASYFLATSDNTRMLVSVTDNVSHNPDGDHYFDLGGDTGLRGYPLRYQNGNDMTLFTLEERLYTHWFPLRLFNVGAAAFYDAGRTWGATLVPTPQLGLLQDVGAGLRLGNARSSFGSVIHVDCAVPLERGNGISRVQFLVTTEQSY